MKLELTRGRFLRRYKRFFADVELPDGEVVTAHCPNTGTMATLLEEGVDAFLTHSDDPKRKLAWTLTLLGLSRKDRRVLVHTSLANRIVEEGLRAGRVGELAGYEEIRREVRYGEKSRIDFLLENGDRPCYVEVKGVTMASSGNRRRSDFPDARTDRGRKHLEELTRLARQGVRAVQFYLLARNDCQAVGIDATIDPDYADALRRARDAGVEVVAYRAEVGTQRITVGRPCPFEFD